MVIKVIDDLPQLRIGVVFIMPDALSSFLPFEVESSVVFCGLKYIETRGK
jgi:hypothetical protein